MTTGAKSKGFRGEDIAVSYLEQMGYTVIERNWRKAHYEIDIVTVKDNILHIVEVKTRREQSKETISNSLNDKKLKSIHRGAISYISTFRSDFYSEIVFDLVVVILKENEDHDIEFIPSFFYPQW